MVKKTIELNPDFLSLNSKKSSKSNKSNKSQKSNKTLPIVKPNKLRKELLARVKNYQKNNEEAITVNSKNGNLKIKDNNRKNIKSDINFDSEFNDSLSFLNSLSLTKKNKKKEKKNKKKLENKLQHNTTLKNNEIIKHNTTLKNNTNLKNNSININLPPELSISTSNNIPIIDTNSTQNSNIETIPIETVPIETVPIQTVPIQTVPIETLPIQTVPIQNIPYKTTSKELVPIEVNSNEIQPQPIMDNESINCIEGPPWGCIKNGKKPTYRNWQNSNLMKTTNNNLNKIKNPNKVKRTKTIKFNLGKTDKKIGILIKDRKTRKLIQHQHGLLKQKPIIDIKNYLRKKNLLKTTSEAPNDVIRHLYEQSILTGDIENVSTDAVVFNYLN